MTRAEALAVLGLEPGASAADVTKAYKHLMQQVHPDRPGGSAFLAKQLNEARRALLGKG